MSLAELKELCRAGLRSDEILVIAESKGRSGARVEVDDVE